MAEAYSFPEDGGPPPMIPAQSHQSDGLSPDGVGLCEEVKGGVNGGGLDDHGPRSTSSAMPDPMATNIPRLRAQVHKRLVNPESIPLSALRFRPLNTEDYDEMVALHTEWFPVSYDDAFYSKSTQGELFTLVATYDGDAGGGSSSSVPHESLVGMITMSTQCEHHGEDIFPVLGGDCAQHCGGNRRWRDPEDPAGRFRGGALAYILTLGVADGFRRRGLAKELLRQSIAHVDKYMPEVQAVYLHVVTYNEAAIQLYEAMRFQKIDRFISFYSLHGKPYDSFLYALYLHQGRPPWKWRLRTFLGIGSQVTWREWVVSAFSSLWRGEPNGAHTKPDPVPQGSSSAAGEV